MNPFIKADFIVFLCLSFNSTPSFSISDMRIAFGVNYKMSLMSLIGITMMWNIATKSKKTYRTSKWRRYW